MSTHEITATRSPYIERVVALGTSIAPIATGILAPLLDSGAAFTATLAYGAVAGITATNYMGRLSEQVLRNLPAGDVIKAHRSPLFIATLTSGMALALGALSGPAGADALLAGVLDLPSMQGAVSLAWWAAVGLVPWKLRLVLGSRGRRRTPRAVRTNLPSKQSQPLSAPVRTILNAWAQHVSAPTGAHPGRELDLATLGSKRWTGVITAPVGQVADVTAEAVSSVYRLPAEWILIQPGGHVGQQRIIVNLTAPPQADASTLEGLWLKRVARPGGVMPHTHLEEPQEDPNTGAQVAFVVADECLDKLPAPDRVALAGALRTTPLLVSYEPRLDPRKAVIRVMDENPLEKGFALPGRETLRANANGYVKLGMGISGFPARIQLFDPKLGAQHLVVAGVTGSGKGGALQLVALAYHVNEAAILYADPKGSSNPAVAQMAASSGLGLEGAMGTLRIAYALLQHRIDESAALGLKNFKPSKERPYVPLILDEASQLLGEGAPYRKEAAFIVAAIAAQGRSLGMPLVLANQILNLDQLGGKAAIRDNLVQGGALLLLRSDSSQKNLVDLPEHFGGVNPADIPAVWAEERGLFYDPDMPEDDPRRTFGLGFMAGPGGHPEMMRTWIQEDAAELIDPDSVLIPADFPDWEDRDEIARTSVLGDGEDDDVLFEDFGLRASASRPKEPTVEEKILGFFEAAPQDPLGLEVIYQPKAAIETATGLAGSTLDNKLVQLVKNGKIHRQVDEAGKTVRGMYGLGPAPEDEN